MKELPWVVECKSFNKFFEPIAAFNDEEVAKSYATSCQDCNPEFEYKVYYKVYSL